MSDDFSPLKSKPFSDAGAKLEGLMTQSGPAFLFGAGSRRCAGLTLTTELTRKALTSNAARIEDVHVRAYVLSLNFTP